MKWANSPISLNVQLQNNRILPSTIHNIILCDLRLLRRHSMKKPTCLYKGHYYMGSGKLRKNAVVKHSSLLHLQTQVKTEMPSTSQGLSSSKIHILYRFRKSWTFWLNRERIVTKNGIGVC